MGLWGAILAIFPIWDLHELSFLSAFKVRHPPLNIFFYSLLFLHWLHNAASIFGNFLSLSLLSVCEGPSLWNQKKEKKKEVQYKFPTIFLPFLEHRNINSPSHAFPLWNFVLFVSCIYWVWFALQVITPFVYTLETYLGVLLLGLALVFRGIVLPRTKSLAIPIFSCSFQILVPIICMENQKPEKTRGFYRPRIARFIDRLSI